MQERFLLPKITGVRFQAGNVSQLRFSFAGAEERGGDGDERSCWFVLPHSYVKSLFFLPEICWGKSENVSFSASTSRFTTLKPKS